MDVSPSTPSKTAVQSIVAHIDLLTVAAITIVCSLLGSIVHEALGHGLTALLLGLHPQHVSTVDLGISYVGVPDWKRRIVNAAGCGAQILAALITFGLLRLIKRGNANTRYFLWLFTTNSLFSVGGYLMIPTLFGFGDWESFVRGLPSPDIWKIGLVLLGVLISLLGLFLGVRYLEPFAGRATTGPEARRRRRLKLIFTPYLVSGIVATLASVFNPTSPLLILISGAAASFGGNAFLLFILSFAHKTPATTSEIPLTPTRDWLWIGLGIVALFVFFFVLGPGLPR